MAAADSASVAPCATGFTLFVRLLIIPKLLPPRTFPSGGTWELYDVNSFGLGSGYRPAFNSGRFVFEPNGDLTYTNNNGDVYQGSWDIRHDYQNDQQYQSLFITVIDFQNQDVISEYFDDMQFTGTDKFKAFINGGTRSFTCKFKR